MQAAVLNPELAVREDVTTSALGAGEIRIRLRAAGICHGDSSAMDGTLWRSGRLDLEGVVSARIRLDEINDGWGALKRSSNLVRQIVTLG